MRFIGPGSVAGDQLVGFVIGFDGCSSAILVGIELRGTFVQRLEVPAFHVFLMRVVVHVVIFEIPDAGYGRGIAVGMNAKVVHLDRADEGFLVK